MIGDFVADGSGGVARAYADIWDVYTRYGSLIGTVQSYGISTTPDDWVPWFVWDYGLEEVVPFVRDLRRVLVEGPTWQRRRGTPRGIEIGLGWVESPGTVAPPDGRHNWWDFQIGFAEPVSDIAQIRQLDGIVQLSKASEDELFRMFSPAADFRPVRMDRHRMDTGGQFDGYSGVPLWVGGPLISFGWAGTVEIEAAITVDAGTEIVTTTTLVWFDGGMRMDRHLLDRSRPGRIITGDIEIDRSSDFLDRRDVWPSAWPKGSWAVGTEPQPISTPLEIA